MTAMKLTFQIAAAIGIVFVVFALVGLLFTSTLQ
jgi:hypothetical protein